MPIKDCYKLKHIFFNNKNKIIKFELSDFYNKFKGV